MTPKNNKYEYIRENRVQVTTETTETYELSSLKHAKQECEEDLKFINHLIGLIEEGKSRGKENSQGEEN